MRLADDQTDIKENKQQWTPDANDQQFLVELIEFLKGELVENTLDSFVDFFLIVCGLRRLPTCFAHFECLDLLGVISITVSESEHHAEMILVMSSQHLCDPPDNCANIYTSRNSVNMARHYRCASLLDIQLDFDGATIKLAWLSNR